MLCAAGAAGVLKEKSALPSRKIPVRQRVCAWVRVTAKVGYKFHNIYRGKGPVLTAISVEPAEKPLNDVVTFS